VELRQLGNNVEAHFVILFTANGRDHGGSEIKGGKAGLGRGGVGRGEGGSRGGAELEGLGYLVFEQLAKDG
jgi:hypothetical protein